MPEAKQYQLAVLNGDGIGPEIMPAAVKILDAAMAAAGAPSSPGPNIRWGEPRSTPTAPPSRKKPSKR